MTRLMDFCVGLAAASIFGLLGVKLKAMDRSGGVVGVILSVLIIYGLGSKGFVLVAAFVLLGSAATRFGYATKLRQGIAQSHRGQRNALHALAKLALPTLAALLAHRTDFPLPFHAAFVGSLGAALADTLGTEVGQVLGKHPFLVWGRRRVPPGTPGAVSLQGLLAGMAGALLIGATGASLNLIPLPVLPGLLVAVLIAQLVESSLGEASVNHALFSNPVRNLGVTLVSGILSGVWVALL